MKYLCDPEVIPAIMPQTALELAGDAARYAEFAPWAQIDIEDGMFVPSRTWPYEAGGSGPERAAWDLKAAPQGLSFEAHLMVNNPLVLGESLARAGVMRIIGHLESFAETPELLSALARWRGSGAREVGVAILLETPLARLEELVPYCDVIQIMCFADSDLGYQGRQFDDRALFRVEELHAKYPDLMVAVDGGVGEAHVEDLVRAGANRLVVGSAIRKSANPEAEYTRILERAERGCIPQPALDSAETS